MICSDCATEFERKSNCQLRCTTCKQKLNLARATAWYQQNKAAKRTYDAQRRKIRREAYNQALRKWKAEHPAEVKADVIARRSKIKKQTPAWANFRYMNLFYKMAKDEQIRTGRKVHVDHIYPLNSSWVCGLHVEDNLQLLFAEDNIRKSNHYSLEHEGMK